MDIKTVIKNELWHVNYIVPFVKKYRFDSNKIEFARRSVRCLMSVKPVKGAGKGRTVGRDTEALLKGVTITVPKSSRFVYFIDTAKTLAVHGNVLSNFTLDYGKIVYGTFEELAGAASGDDEYGEEADAVASGIRALTRRIVRQLEESDMPEPARSRRIREFTDMLERPAKHFEEALQRILFFNQILWQTRHRLNGLGRLDYMLEKLYAEDISSGYMTKNDATDAITDFMGQLSRYSEYKSDALMGDIGQIVILGGLKPDGSYFSNALTELFLKAQAALSKPDPKTLLRVSKSMPDTLLAVAVECLKSKTGSPLFSNDDVVIPALVDFGMSEDDAYSYCTSACWEPYIVGKSLDQNNIAVYDFFPPFDALLRRNINFDSFEDMFDAYLSENDACFKKFLKGLDAFVWAKDPLVSMFTSGANEERKDISEGSAFYNNYGITTVALSNTVDSLLNIKHLVFEGRGNIPGRDESAWGYSPDEFMSDRKYTLGELENARRNDFKNRDELSGILRKGRSYGRDDDEAVELTQRITGRIAHIAGEYRNCYGGTVKFGLSSPGYNMLSRRTAADFSGRKAGMPYNTHISCTDAAYTEVVGFASQLSYTDRRFNGNVVDFFLPGQFLKQNAEKFALFLKGAIRQGFFQMQMNIMDSETLMKAKAHPENYAGLIVRVWGFSAYFNDLPESYKDLMIERAKAAEQVI